MDPLYDILRPFIPADLLEQIVADFHRVSMLTLDQEEKGRPVFKTLLECIPPDDRRHVFYDIRTNATFRSTQVALLAEKWSEDARFEEELSNLQVELDSANKDENKTIEVEWCEFTPRTGYRPEWSLRLVQTLHERDFKRQSLDVPSLSIKVRDLVSEASSSTGTENLLAWTNYIRNCQLFQRISVDMECNGPFLTDEVVGQNHAKLLFEAIAANVGLETVDLFYSYGTENTRKLRLPHLLTLLHFKPSLRRLVMGTYILHDDDHFAFAQALGANCSLDTVELYLSDERDLALFPELAKIPTLKKAIFASNNAYLACQDGITSFIRSSDTLEHLSLLRFRFSEGYMNRLRDAIDGRAMLTKVFFGDCYYEGDSAQVLVDAVHSSAVCEFGLRLGTGGEDYNFSERAFVSLCTNQTAGLRVIDCHFRWRIDCVLSTWLSFHAEEICVPCLRIRGWKDNDLGPVGFVLDLRQVKNVEIVLVLDNTDDDDLVFDDFKRMVKDNVSLYKLSVWKEDENDVLIPTLTAKENALLEAYGQRNEFLPLLLACEYTNDKSKKSDDATAETFQDSAMVAPILPHLPSLVTVGRTMPPPYLMTSSLAGMTSLCGNHDHNDGIVAHSLDESTGT